MLIIQIIVLLTHLFSKVVYFRDLREILAKFAKKNAAKMPMKILNAKINEPREQLVHSIYLPDANDTHGYSCNAIHEEC